MTKVTIMVPTRNRPHLLRYALASALRQEGIDFEVLVSDNSSSGDSLEVANSFRHAALRYVRTPGDLSMPDSWEFALHQSRGEYVTVLPDDDVYVYTDAIRQALQELEKCKLQVAVWNLCSYISPDWFEPTRRNTLIVKSTSFRSHVLDSEIAVRRLHYIDQQYPVPKFLNSLCHRSIPERAIASTGRFFWGSCPDFTAAATILCHVPRYLFIDRPFYIDGVSPVSIGAVARFNWGQAAQTCIKEFGNGTLFTDAVQLQIPTSAVHIAHCLERVKRLYPGVASGYTIDTRSLVTQSIDTLTMQQRNGADTAESWQALDTFLAQQPAHIRQAARKRKRISGVAAAIRANRHRVAFQWLDQFRGVHAFSGSRHGFSNILECAEAAPILISRVASGTFSRAFRKREW